MYDLMLSGGNPFLVKKLFQQQWQLSAELYWRMCEHRKESCIPGSVVFPQEVLSDKDGLSLAQQAIANGAGWQALERLRAALPAPVAG